MHGEGRASDGLHCSCDRATSTFGTRRLVPRRTSTVLGKRVASVAREVCPECLLELFGAARFLELFEQAGERSGVESVDQVGAAELHLSST